MKFPRRPREEVNVNLTPLIDVVFLLLIFFMVSTTFNRQTQLQVNLPTADQSAQPLDSQQQPIELVIDQQGKYNIDGLALVNNSARTLRIALTKRIDSSSEIPALLVSADAAAPHQSVVTVMDVAGRLGFAKLNITTTAGSQ